jgi:hypothetical protein
MPPPFPSLARYERGTGPAKGGDALGLRAAFAMLESASGGEIFSVRRIRRGLSPVCTVVTQPIRLLGFYFYATMGDFEPMADASVGPDASADRVCPPGEPDLTNRQMALLMLVT